MFEFRNSLAEFGSGYEPQDRLVRVLRKLCGEWEPTDANIATLQNLGYPQSMAETWRQLWNAWLEANPEIAEIQDEADSGLAYHGVRKTEAGYRLEFSVQGKTYKRRGFATSQAAARCADQIRREHGAPPWDMIFPTPDEIAQIRSYKPRAWKLAVIKTKPAKEPPALRTDVPGARHGVMRTGTKWGAVHSARWLGTFETVRDAMLAYNSAVLAAPRKSQGKQPLLNFIEEAA